MSHPFHHALSAKKKFGGKTIDYLPINEWFDQSKSFYASWRHRALRHHAQGIFECEKVFGITIVNSDGKEIPTRLIAEMHVKEDLGWIPTLQDWFSNIQHKDWMTKGVQKIDLEDEDKNE